MVNAPLNSILIIAFQVGKPVRLMLDRDEDMMLTGYRHPFLAKYKVGFNEDGRVQAVDMDLFANAGWSSDLSIYVTRQAVIKCENSYSIPNFKVRGRTCKTNLASNTAFRGFGGKQGTSKIHHAYFLSENAHQKLIS